jgi:hypothetical protein
LSSNDSARRAFDGVVGQLGRHRRHTLGCAPRGARVTDHPRELVRAALDLELGGDELFVARREARLEREHVGGGGGADLGAPLRFVALPRGERERLPLDRVCRAREPELPVGADHAAHDLARRAIACAIGLLAQGLGLNDRRLVELDACVAEERLDRGETHADPVARAELERVEAREHRAGVETPRAVEPERQLGAEQGALAQLGADQHRVARVHRCDARLARELRRLGADGRAIHDQREGVLGFAALEPHGGALGLDGCTTQGGASHDRGLDRTSLVDRAGLARERGPFEREDREERGEGEC